VDTILIGSKGIKSVKGFLLGGVSMREIANKRKRAHSEELSFMQ
jgi:hypothetical protein